MNLKRIGVCFTSLVLGAGLCVSFTTACAGKSSITATTSDAAHTFNYWVTKTDGTGVGGSINNYEQNPGVVWATERDFTYKSAVKGDSGYTLGDTVTNKVALHFESPVSGQEQNSFITSLASGTTDILELDYAPETVAKMYENGKLLDLTWWVENYMPNYRAYVEENGLYNYMTTEINGERKYLQLYNMLEPTNESFWGYQYRRDWVLKYGVDPSEGKTTGDTFAQQHSDWGWQTVDGESVWVDGITFPSYYGYRYTTADNGSETGMGSLTYDETLASYIKNTYPALITSLSSDYQYEQYEGQWPVTISDWEWMLDIFQIAIADLGYTKVGYCMSLYQPGFINTGNLVSSFGGGGVEWYRNTDGEIVFGGDTDTFKTYVETMSQWYANGWIDVNFQSHSDVFWRWDENTVRQGYVGLYYGMNDQLLGGMDSSKGVAANPTNGICSYGMPFPINDKYGDSSLQYQIPYCFYELATEGNSIMVTTAAERNGKDLAALFTFLDSLYTEEAANVKGAGLSKEMLAESQAGIQDLYNSYGLENGAYYIGEDGKAYTTPEYDALSEDVQYLVKPIRLFGIEGEVPSAQTLKTDIFRKELWTMFKASGYLYKSFFSQLSTEEYDIYNQYCTSMRNNFISEVPKFIKGTKTMAEWDTWYSNLKSTCKIDLVTQMLEELNKNLEG